MSAMADGLCSPQVMPFFNRVGFALPERKGIADFLQEVTSPKDQGQYWCDALGHPRSGHDSARCIPRRC